MKILVIDIGGTHVKILASGQAQVRRFDSSPGLTPSKTVSAVLGGGNAAKLKSLPKNVRLADSANAFAGGFKLWPRVVKPGAVKPVSSKPVPSKPVPSKPASKKLDPSEAKVQARAIKKPTKVRSKTSSST